MKNKAKELDVDFISEQNYPLTKEEEKAISDFIRIDKEKRKIKEHQKKRLQKEKKTNLPENSSKRLPHFSERFIVRLLGDYTSPLSLGLVLKSSVILKSARVLNPVQKAAVYR